MSFIKRGDALPILHTINPENVEDEKVDLAKGAMKEVKVKTEKQLPDVRNPGNKIESN